MSRTRDGISGCWCCGLKHINEAGWCDICVGRGHDQAPLPTQPASGEHRQHDAPPYDRQQSGPPRDRQITEPRRDR
ncbi:hypothetical protein ACWD0D_34540 [Streptomyces griseoincarnatus]